MQIKEIISKLTSQNDPKEWIIVTQGKIGMETYYNPEIKKLPTPYKTQLKEFLEGAIKELK